MIHRFVAWFVLTALVTTSSGQNQKSAPVSKQKPQTSFTEKLLKFLGIADSPGTLKGPGDEVTSGELWLADLQAKTKRALASGEGYRSPIFWAGSKDILVLRDTEVVRVPSTGGEGKSLYSVQGILKLVGASSEDPTTVLILVRDQTGGRPRVGLLTVSTGAVAPVPYDPASSQDLQMVENLAGWSRTYGNQHVYVQKQHKQALSGTVEWHDVFVQVDGNPPVDVSQCDGVNCGQPSLSPDGHWLVFVRAKAE
jgi:hypothetical protein